MFRHRGIIIRELYSTKDDKRKTLIYVLTICLTHLMVPKHCMYLCMNVNCAAIVRVRVWLRVGVHNSHVKLRSSYLRRQPKIWIVKYCYEC
jgi:hypothetical protein